MEAYLMKLARVLRTAARDKKMVAKKWEKESRLAAVFLNCIMG